ncbi:MAG: hypothetical protein K2W82_11435 [Candidatus Obscuribacterales bacterium]|nr:hypothetical protein [Candidatus Obscuribacterales bacterium]
MDVGGDGDIDFDGSESGQGGHAHNGHAHHGGSGNCAGGGLADVIAGMFATHGHAHSHGQAPHGQGITQHHGHFCAFSRGYAGHALGSMSGRCLHGYEAESLTSIDLQCQEVRRIILPGVMAAANTVQALVWPHGQCDTRKIFAEAALKSGLVDVGWRRQRVCPSDTTSQEICDTTPFDGIDHNTPMPSGWLPKVTGHTRLWQDFYQVVEPVPVWKFWGKPDANLQQRTYLIVDGATWHFNQFGDYETRLAITAKLVRYYADGKWRYYEEEIVRNLIAARAAAEAFFANVKTCLPNSSSVILRKWQAEREARLLADSALIRALPPSPEAFILPPPPVVNNKPTASSRIASRYFGSLANDQMIEIEMSGIAGDCQ